VIEGSCHCGAVRWRLEATPEAATACNCTVCRRYAALWAYGHEGEDVEVSGTTRAYLRGAPWRFTFVRIAVALPIGAPWRPTKADAVWP